MGGREEGVAWFTLPTGSVGVLITFSIAFSDQQRGKYIAREVLPDTDFPEDGDNSVSSYGVWPMQSPLSCSSCSGINFSLECKEEFALVELDV